MIVLPAFISPTELCLTRRRNRVILCVGFFLLLLLINYFIYLHPKCCSPSRFPLKEFFLLPLPLHNWEGAPKYFSPWLGIKSLQIRCILSHRGQKRQLSVTYFLLYVSCWPWTNPFMLFGWCLRLWDLQGMQVSWHYWSSCGVTIPFCSFTLCPNFFTEVPCLCPMLSCGYLHLSLLAAG